MGGTDRSETASRIASLNRPPESDEIEVTLFGRSIAYGEGVLVHFGNQEWMTVDSCLDESKEPAALAYLSNLGLNPADVVRLIVASHWHDDHIKGIGRLVEVCENAAFCCATALLKDEFLSLLSVHEEYLDTPAGSGVNELFTVFNLLVQRGEISQFAIANRLLLDAGGYTVKALSPSDRTVHIFLQRLRTLVAELGEKYRRLPRLERNDASVVLLVEANESAVLLGGDLERPGWLDILADDQNPGAKADVFKVPHHGSETAQVDQIWTDLLIDGPLAILTPFKNGSVLLPTSANVDYILSYTDQAYSTARPLSGNRPRRGPAVESTFRETGATIRQIPVSDGIIRLRKKLDASSEWSVETFGAAGHLRESVS